MNAQQDRMQRCDRCGAAAKFEVLLPSGNNLLFCAHHGYQYGDALIEAGAILPMTAREPVTS